MTIRPAKTSDIHDINKIAKSVSIEHRQNTDGFLMSNYSEKDYRKFLAAAPNVTFLVSTNSLGRICAFLLAYNQNYANSLNNSDTVNIIKKSIGLNARYSIIKQIAVSPDCQGQGHASRLYEEYFNIAKGNHVFTTIVSEPENPASEHFHRSQGFSPLFTTRSTENDGSKSYRSRVWHASAPFSLEGAPEATPMVLVENLHIANQLYLHEDNLNWTKIRFLVTILFSLIVAAWALTQLPNWGQARSLEGSANAALSVLLIISGFLILHSVGRKIHSGLRFMASHKECVRLLESRLASMQAGFVTPVLKVPETAETIKIMKWLPAFSVIAWAVTSALLAYKAAVWYID